MQMTIRAELENYLKKSEITINQFAEVSGVNSGTISSIINGNRSIAVQQLDRITEGMGLAEGSFYELYVDECFYQSAPNWRRLGPLIFRCAELDKLDCIKQVVGMMMDNLSYAPVLFETAETLFKQDKHNAAAILYGSVAESEKYQHSERLALCQYRLFKIALCEDQEINLKAAVQFESFVNRLDEVDQLDALKDLANLYFSIRQWNKVEGFAKEMEQKATVLYKYRHRENRRKDFFKEPTNPLFVYIAFPNVLYTGSYGARGDYDQALYYASLYSDMSWVEENSEEVMLLKDKFEVWSIANTYLYQLMKGNIEVLQEYVEYIEHREDEVLPALFKILQAANIHGFDVDDVLLRFEKVISKLKKERIFKTYIRSVTEERYNRFIIELSLYYLTRKQYSVGINFLLESMETSSIMSDEGCVIRCIGLFERFRCEASFEALAKYQNLISEVYRRNDEKNGFVIISS